MFSILQNENVKYLKDSAHTYIFLFAKQSKNKCINIAPIYNKMNNNLVNICIKMYVFKNVANLYN